MFLNDSIVAISDIPRHMGRMARIELSYKKDDGKVVVYTTTNSADSIIIKDFGFSNGKELVYEDRALVNEINEELYVVRSDFKKNRDMFVIIDDKKYILDMGTTDGYGLVKRKPRRNWRLKWKMKSIRKDNPEIEVLSGYDAYQKYGYRYAFGVIEVRVHKQ